MPEDSSLERTAQVAREIAAALRQEKEVTDYQVYVGTAAPYSFNGLMRHYDLRRGSSLAEVQINLLPKEQRSVQSHAFALRIRPAVAAIAARHGARSRWPRCRPGLRCCSRWSPRCTARTPRRASAWPRRMRNIFAAHARGGRRGLVRGISAAQGAPASSTRRRQPCTASTPRPSPGRSASPWAASRSGGCTYRMSRRRSTSCSTCPGRQRAGVADLLDRLPDDRGQALVPLGELVRVESTRRGPEHLPQESLAGRLRHRRRRGGTESPAYAILEMNKADRAAERGRSPSTTHPATERCATGHQVGRRVAHHARAVPRSRARAFAVVLLLIYALLVGWFRSFSTPLVVMAPIPFSLVGILPAHAALGAFFTATSLIGFMAGAGSWCGTPSS